MKGIRVTVRATVRAPRELVFETMVPIDLTSIMRGYAFLPAVVAVDGHDGSWNARGQTRTLRLADGNALREELTEYRKPDGVRYMIDGITGPLGTLVHGARGSFDFTAHDHDDGRVDLRLPATLAALRAVRGVRHRRVLAPLHGAGAGDRPRRRGGARNRTRRARERGRCLKLFPPLMDRPDVR